MLIINRFDLTIRQFAALFDAAQTHSRVELE
jgi:hypothetical protein